MLFSPKQQARNPCREVSGPTALILGYDRGCPCEYFCLLGIDSIFIIEVLNHNELCSVDQSISQDLSFLNPIESIASQVQNRPPS